MVCLPRVSVGNHTSPLPCAVASTQGQSYTRNQHSPTHTHVEQKLTPTTSAILIPTTRSTDVHQAITLYRIEGLYLLPIYVQSRSSKNLHRLLLTFIHPAPTQNPESSLYYTQSGSSQYSPYSPEPHKTRLAPITLP